MSRGVASNRTTLIGETDLDFCYLVYAIFLDQCSRMLLTLKGKMMDIDRVEDQSQGGSRYYVEVDGEEGGAAGWAWHHLLKELHQSTAKFLRPGFLTQRNSHIHQHLSKTIYLLSSPYRKLVI